MSACVETSMEDMAVEVAEKGLKEPSGADIDAEYGIKDLLTGKISDDDVKSGKFVHDVHHLDVDLDALTSGDIDWVKAMSSLEWMVNKTKDALATHDNAQVSQFLAKTCVMHVIQCFHHCRTDEAPGFAREGGSSPSPPPSEKE